MGHGDSEGNFEDSTVNSRVSDVTAAINYLSEVHKIKKVILLGIRFGATVAALACQDNKIVDGNILIAILSYAAAKHTFIQHGFATRTWAAAQT